MECESHDGYQLVMGEKIYLFYGHTFRLCSHFQKEKAVKLW